MPVINLPTAAIGALLGSAAGILFVHLIGSWRHHPVAATACLTLIIGPALLGALLGACKED